MNLMTMLLTGVLMIGGIGASASVIDNPSAIEQTNTPSQTINELQAKVIALDVSKGGLVTNTYKSEKGNIKKYEITIVNHNTEFEVDIDASTGNVLNFQQSI